MLLIAKLLITLLLSLVMQTTILKNPSQDYAAGGSPIGICDGQKHDVVPANYSRIDYAGHGLFVAWSINRQNRYKLGDELTVLTYDGKMCDIKMPDGGKLHQVFWLGKDVDDHPDTLLTRMPPDAIFTFRKESRFGLCDAQGNVILDPKYGFIGHAYEGKAFVTPSFSQWREKQGQLFLFDCHTRQLTDLGVHYLEQSRSTHFSEGLAVLGGDEGKYGFIDEKGKFVIEPKYFGATGFSQGVASVVTSKRATFGGFGDSVLIDKSGRTVSPANLSVRTFIDDLAAAREIDEEPPRFGLVDRKFHWVVKPCYATLWAENQPFTGYTDTAYMNNTGKNGGPFWVVMKAHNGPVEFLSLTGKKIGGNQSGLRMDGIQEPNVLRWQTSVHDKYIYTDLNGHILPDSYGRTLVPPDAPPYQDYPTFKMVAPDRFLKIIHSDSGHFDPEYWESKKNHPISRISMFNRLLADYNLIGMRENQLRELLGKPKTHFGFIDQSIKDRCDDFPVSEWDFDDLSIRVYFLEGKVSGWSFVNGKGISDLIQRNVEFRDGPDDERLKNPFSFIKDKQTQPSKP